MENENQKINRVRLFADLAVFDSPRNELTKSPVAFRSGDGVRFDVVLFANGALADCSNMASIVFEILDIGAVNEPLLRAPTALVRKTVSAESLDTELDAEGLAAGGAHFSLELSSAEASIGAGDRYLKICAFDAGGDRATFAAGWIKVFDDYCAELSDTPANSANVAQQLQSEISAHETRIQSLEGDVEDLSGAASGHALSIGGLSSDKADKATTLAGYGIADAYTKAEADGNLAAALAPCSAQIAEIRQAKLNGGALHFANGKAANALFNIPATFSLACVVSGDYSGTVATLGNGVLSAAAGVLSFTDGVDNISAAGSAEQSNVAVLIVSPTATKLIVNGNQTNGALSVSGTGYEFGSTASTSGAIANIAMFNFDISAAGAPYTLDDYAANKPISPKLWCGQDAVPSTVGPNAWTETPGVITPATGAPLAISGGVYTWTRSASGAVSTYSRYYFQKNLRAGAAINVSFGNITAVNSQFTNCYLVYADNSKSAAQSIAQNSTLNFAAAKEAKAVEIDFNFTSSALANDTLQLDALNIRANGALLKLANSVFNGEVFDLSGNGNTASISDNIIGQDDIYMETLYQKIAARISNNL